MWTETDPSQTILVDLTPGKAASATAALNVGRCLVGAALVAAVQYVINDIGNGWTFTLFPLASFIIPMPIIECVIRFGPRWHCARNQRKQSMSQSQE